MTREELLENPKVLEFLDKLINFKEDNLKHADIQMNILKAKWELWRDARLLELDAAGFKPERKGSWYFVRGNAEIHISLEWPWTEETFYEEYFTQHEGDDSFMYGMSAAKHPCETGADDIGWFETVEECIKAFKELNLY